MRAIQKPGRATSWHSTSRTKHLSTNVLPVSFWQSKPRRKWFSTALSSRIMSRLHDCSASRGVGGSSLGESPEEDAASDTASVGGTMFERGGTGKTATFLIFTAAVVCAEMDTAARRKCDAGLCEAEADAEGEEEEEGKCSYSTVISALHVPRSRACTVMVAHTVLQG